MRHWLTVDWHALFVPSVPVLETVIRGTCLYLAIFCMLRFFRRQTGSLGPADLLVLLLIADAAQNGMTGDYKSITDGVILIGTIIGWEFAIDQLGFHSLWAQKLLERSPLLLIKDGHVLLDNLRSELITHDDLIAQLRKNGVERPEQVKRCFLEGDGHVSVITSGPAQHAAEDADPTSG